MEIRKATMADVKGIAKVHVDSWRTTYADIVPEDYLNRLTYESREQLWENNLLNNEVFVAEDKEKQTVGFSTGGKIGTQKYPSYTGELYAIYILKEYQKNGLGKRLVKPVTQALQQKGISTMIVKVLEDNDACFFYEALQGKKIDTVEEQIAGKTLNECVYGWKDIKVIV